MDRLNEVFYINLDHRTDRNEQMISEFKKLNFTDYTRFEAVKSIHGVVNGCTLSHFRLWDMISRMEIKPGKLPYILILEDNAKFKVNRNVLDQYINEFLALNPNYRKLLALGFNLGRKQRYKKSRSFFYGLFFYTTSAYLISIPTAIKFIKRLQRKHISYNVDYMTNITIDIYIHRYQDSGYYLIPNTHLVVQRSSYSDILNKKVHYGI